MRSQRPFRWPPAAWTPSPPRSPSTGSTRRPPQPRSRASLRPGAAVALIWNRRDESVDWMREFSRILDAHAGDAPRYRAGLWRRGFDANPDFEPLELRTWSHRGAEGRDVVLARVASISFVAALDEAPRAGLLAEFAELLDTHPDTRGRDDVALPYVTELFTTRRTLPGSEAPTE